METKKKWTKSLRTMDFKLAIAALVLIFSFSACLEKNKNYTNIGVVKNATNDTIYIKWRYSEGNIFPDSQAIVTDGDNETTIEYLSKYFTNLDTFYLYKHQLSDTILCKKWAGPLKDLPDSIHSYFNKNSWKITYQGRKNEYEVATFTITEDDLKK